MSEEDLGSGIDTISRDETDTEEPSMYRVVLLNDDYTPMDFVVMVLENIFRKTPSEAVRIMLEIHHKGKGLCGLFTHEVAETKAALVHERARAMGHPLKCQVVKE